MRFSWHIFFVISISVFSISNSVTFQATDLKELDSEFVQRLGSSDSIAPAKAVPSSVLSSSRIEDRSKDHVQIIREQSYQKMPPETFPIMVDKYVLSNYVDYSYGNKTVCILVKCTNYGEKLLNDVNIYEIVPDYLSIENCSFPIKTSSFDEIFRYERNGARILCVRDILSPEKFSKKLMCNDTISRYIRKNNLAINNSSSTAKNLSVELNKIICCSELYNQKQLFDLNSSILGEQTKKLLKLARNNKTQKDDNILLNFILLRDSYPSYILKPNGFLEIQENKNVFDDASFINIKIPKMRPGETVLFKYYLLISDFGSYRTNTQIHLDEGKYANFQVPLDIEFLAPKFNVQVALTKLNFLPGESIHINYIVDLLTHEDMYGGYIFPTIVETNNKDISFENESNQLDFSFSNGNKSLSKSVNITESFEKLINRNAYILLILYYLVYENTHRFCH